MKLICLHQEAILIFQNLTPARKQYFLNGNVLLWSFKPSVSDYGNVWNKNDVMNCEQLKDINDILYNEIMDLINDNSINHLDIC